ncbi:MAG: VWA domain-containing protein [Bacteroidetes bacterium]|nr:VWA domain-containing protein [Bacteroidota bacterium]MBU1116470.1 VWA domain-containing protein [Bacteroidota bacterium]MBU1797295.1 VWA domain-containing protein [Bacteroidota bacterium]
MLRKITLLFGVLLLNAFPLLGNGVGIIDSENPTVLELISSDVAVDVENQVAIISSKQTFKNNFGSDSKFKYAFPLPEGASATELRWFKNGIWETAIISVEPQDTTLPGGGSGGTIANNLKEYLGLTPLYFNFEDELLKDSLITIELKYVQLLSYDFGKVSFEYSNNYQLIQSTPIDMQGFQFNLTSSRTIVDVNLLNHDDQIILNDGTNANIHMQIYESAADKDYEVLYSLSTEEFGLFGFSTMLADSLVFDKEEGTGFFTFVAEPNPENGTDVIDKVFTLIIDKSGSMGGNKIEQARSAAEFIVNNLNEGDRFNIVDFESSVFSFRNTHVANTPENRTAALNYISTLSAGGGTNISGALTTSISQFSSANDSTANIIVFFTDGEATSGTTGTSAILDLVQTEIANNETDITIFTFGIGTGANRQLLTLLANNNNGISEFLENDEVEEVITQFYLKIKSPVLINTEISFSSDNIKEIFPIPLPSLYKGQQMIVSGRYSEASETVITLKGSAFGKHVEYNYALNLSDKSIAKYQFLPKIWAKQKIEYLMVQYFSLSEGSTEADILKEQILTLSLAYGIITEFTSFSEGVTGMEEEQLQKDNIIVDDFRILGNYPNPFNPSTKISFSVGLEFHDVVTIKIYNSIGQLVRVLTINVNGMGVYEVTWNGLMQNGDSASSDVYIYTIDFGNRILAGKMLLLK